MLANPDYATKMDYLPYCEYSTNNDERQWQDFMSGDWAWNQAVWFPLYVCLCNYTYFVVRISYLKTPTPLAPHLCQLYSVVTRRPFQSQLAQTITTPCMHRLGMFVTMSGGHTAMPLPSLGSLRCQKVSGILLLPLRHAN